MIPSHRLSPRALRVDSYYPKGDGRRAVLCHHPLSFLCPSPRVRGLHPNTSYCKFHFLQGYRQE